MPGSNEYSVSSALTAETGAAPAAAAPAASPFYQKQGFQRKAFDKNAKLAEMYGTQASRRDKRRFERYWNSDKRVADEKAFNEAEDSRWLAHEEAESKKYLESFDAYINNALENLRKKYAAPAAAAAPAPIAPTAPAPKYALAPRTDWNARAQQYGFKSMDEVKQWQAQNGLVADGKFGNQSLAKWNELQGAQAAAPAPASVYYPFYYSLYYPLYDLSPNAEIPVYTNDNTQTSSKVVTTKPTFDFSGFGKRYELKTETVNGKKYLRYDPDGFGDFYIGEDGTVYTVGAPNYPLTYKDIPEHSLIRKNAKTLFTMLDDFNSGKTKAYDQWYAAYVAEHPKPAFNASLAGSDDQTQWNKAFAAAKKAAGYKQGGRFNRVSYFQQGGAAPQQDIKAQVTALVQAAMQGDQKATQQVNQILEAAKAGDQQAMQIAQMIQQVVEQMQGQATSAKWGTKLGYIKSLKYAKGGKTCPVCEKKVEMKACGGKKAKKRYFGGLI